MRVDLFEFDLPRDRIALHPASPRESAKLLVVDDDLADLQVRDLPDIVRAGDVMVFNDTRVIPARLKGRRGDARVEVTLHQQVGDGEWKAFARPAKRLKAGQKIVFDGGLTATVNAREAGEVSLTFDQRGGSFWAILDTTGQMPLPPYIGRDKTGDPRDQQDYQTIYARDPGAVAAPTAGLHFTEALFDALDSKGIKRVFSTLHVGAGTFLPVTVDDTDDHVMHAEHGHLSADSAAAINEARRAGGRVVAVGSTSLRLLEAACDDSGRLHEFDGDIDLFAVPGYRFKAVDMMLTNFHLPRSTLFMLVSAFCGVERMQRAYRHAIDNDYRFYSYGDACLLGRRQGDQG